MFPVGTYNLHYYYTNYPYNLDTEKKPTVNFILNFEQYGFTTENADGTANTVDHDQTAPAFWSWSTLFAQNCPVLIL